MALYEKYLNIQKFITDYRKYSVKEAFLSEEKFHKTMNMDTYIKIDCRDKKGKPIIMYFLHPDSDYAGKASYFSKLMQQVKTPTEIMFIMRNEPSTYIAKAMVKREFNHIIKHIWLHIIFALEIPRGPHCPTHTILNENEKKILLTESLKIHPLKLPVIYKNDPQCIWIGAEIGDIIKIEGLSYATGISIRYKIVSPPAGKNYIKYKSKKQDAGDTQSKDQPDGQNKNADDDEEEMPQKDDDELDIE